MWEAIPFSAETLFSSHCADGFIHARLHVFILSLRWVVTEIGERMCFSVWDLRIVHKAQSGAYRTIYKFYLHFL
jgi:hypothetical protein